MVSRRVLSVFLSAIAFTSQILAQTVTPQPQPSPALSSETRVIAMTVSDGTPLQIALDKEVRVRKVGEPITGRVMQPVYVFDHLVIPIGTAATGRISAIDPVPGRVRTLSALNADFTPSRKLSVTFDELILPDGRHIDLHANIVPGSGQVSVGNHRGEQDGAASAIVEPVLGRLHPKCDISQAANPTRSGASRSTTRSGSLHQTSKIVRLGPSGFGPSTSRSPGVRPPSGPMGPISGSSQRLVRPGRA